MIDAHQHFWDQTKFHYSWLSSSQPVLNRDYLPQDLEPLAKEAGVLKTVVVQALPSAAETRWLLNITSGNDLVGGVVGWIDLKSPSVGDELNNLKKAPKLKGIRHQAEDELDRQWILQKDVLNGLQKVAQAGLSFDALLKHDQLWQLKVVLGCCPQLRIVIDHAAKPDIRQREFDSWAEDLKKASALPVMCKFSGLFTEAEHKSWTQSDIEPYYRHILNVFGPERVMFGSDWPVSTMASDYQRTIDVSFSLCSGLTVGQREMIFHKNAQTFYKIE
jgi:L-fuconolactonase